MMFTDLPFLGRVHEMTRLQEIVNDAVNHRGACVFINGIPGAGKSRLVGEFISKKVDQDIFVLKIEVGDLTSTDEQLLFSAIREYLRTVKSLKLIPKIIDDPTYHYCYKHIPELTACFPYEPSAPRTRLTITEMLYRFFYNLTVFSPAVILVEDVHNSSPETIKVLEYIITKIKSLPIMFLLTARPCASCSDLLHRLRTAVDTELIDLHALDINEIMGLNATLFNDQMPLLFFTWLNTKAKGNPIFIKEILRYLLEKGIVYLDSQRNSWMLIEPVKQIPLPRHLYEIIAAHARLLKSPMKEFVLYSALIDEPVSASLIGIRLSKKEENLVLKTGIMLMKNGYFSYSHPLYREAIHNMLSAQERQKMHEQLGNLLMAKNHRELALIQYVKAGRRDKSIIDDLIRIINDCRAKGDNARALSYSELIFNFVKNSPPELTVRYIKWTQAYVTDLLNRGRNQRALEVAETIMSRIQAAHMAVPQKNMASMFSLYIRVLHHAGRYQHVVDFSAKALKYIDRVKMRDRNALIFKVKIDKAYALQHLGKTKKALALVAALQKKCRHSSEYDDYRIASLLGSIYNNLGHYQKSTEFRKQALARAFRLSSKPQVATAQGNLGLAYVNIGEFEPAKKFFTLHQNYEIEHGYLREVSISHLNFAYLYFQQGNFSLMQEQLMKGWTICEQIGSLKDMVWFHLYYGAIQLISGNMPSAGYYFDQALDWARRYKFSRTIDDLLTYKSLVYALTGDLPQLKKVMLAMKAAGGHKLRPNKFANIEGLCLVLAKKSKTGMSCIRRVYKNYEGNDQHPELCRMIFINAQIFKKNQIASGSLAPFIDKARMIAKKYDMQGWQDWYDGVHIRQAAGPLRIHTLGNLTVEIPGKGYLMHKDWEWRKVRDLFAVLVCAYLDKHRLTRDQIGLLLWPEFSRQQVVNNFHVCLTRLKNAIGKNHIRHETKTYCLTDIWIDAGYLQDLMHDAEELLSSGIVHGAEKKLDCLIDLYRGNFFEDVFDPWVENRRTIITGVYRQALLMAGSIAIRKLQFDKAELLGKKLLSIDPLDEESHRFLIHCYIKSSDKAKALAQFDRCMKLFRHELGCDPSENIRNMLKNIHQM